MAGDVKWDVMSEVKDCCMWPTTDGGEWIVAAKFGDSDQDTVSRKAVSAGFPKPRPMEGPPPGWRGLSWPKPRMEHFTDVTELKYLELVCPHENCKTRITFDMTTPRVLPEFCPICKRTWRAASNVGTFDAFRRFVLELSEGQYQARFRIQVAGAPENKRD